MLTPYSGSPITVAWFLPSWCWLSLQIQRCDPVLQFRKINYRPSQVQPHESCSWHPEAPQVIPGQGGKTSHSLGLIPSQGPEII